MFAILKTIKLSSKYQKKYSWLFSRMKIKKNEHYLSLGYYFKSELKDPNKFLPTCNPDDNQTNALSKESIQFRWWTGFYNEKTFEKRQLFLAHLIILWRIKKVSFQKKNQMKNVSNFVFLTSAVQKNDRLSIFSGSGLHILTTHAGQSRTMYAILLVWPAFDHWWLCSS